MMFLWLLYFVCVVIVISNIERVQETVVRNSVWPRKAQEQYLIIKSLAIDSFLMRSNKA